MTRISLSEQQMLQELDGGRESLLAANSGLLMTLRRELQSITRNLYVLHWIPEQGEDLYDVLVDGITVVHVEMERATGVCLEFSRCTVEDYLRKRDLGQLARRKLRLALQLANADSRPR